MLDLNLPRVDGREVLEEVKADDTLAGIPIVVITSSPSEADWLRSQWLQVDGYVTKPVDGEKFRRLILNLRRFWHSDLILPGIALTT